MFLAAALRSLNSYKVNWKKVEQIASPMTDICPHSENLKFYVNYVPCKLLV